jgi:leader peptidase (prepilin peptidase)/N-methyltransferase
MTIAAPIWFLALFGGTVGAVFGSFINVLIYRVPRGMSVISPPSACPTCEARIQPYDNVPILGWLWLGGRCRRCRANISIRYPAIEALTAIVFVALLSRPHISVTVKDIV